MIRATRSWLMKSQTKLSGSTYIYNSAFVTDKDVHVECFFIVFNIKLFYSQ